MNSFSCEQSFDHTTQDEDHGEKLAGHGGSEKHEVKRRSVRAPSNQGGQISIGTQHSENSNESHGQNFGEQFGYEAYRYGQYGDVQSQYGVFDYNQFGFIITIPFQEKQQRAQKRSMTIMCITTIQAI